MDNQMTIINAIIVLAQKLCTNNHDYHDYWS
jgi:hypothetical protein